MPLLRALLRGACVCACVGASHATAYVMLVGPARAVVTLAEAARKARSGDVIEVDAGRYVDDVAVFTQDELVIRAVGGRARFVSTGAMAQDKAIVVVRGRDVTVEGLEFTGARVADHNGAGIRHETGRLTVRDCLFEDNEMGILTSNDASAELVVERSEFRRNAVDARFQPGDPGHQIYVGLIGRFTLRESYVHLSSGVQVKETPGLWAAIVVLVVSILVHQGAFGHLVKSRARETRIENNRITDEPPGRSSYEIDLPSGGDAWIIGNLIGQSATTENNTIVSFGAEGYRWPVNGLVLAFNTIVDALPHGGRVLAVREGATAVDVLDNVVLGNSLQASGTTGRFADNRVARASDFVAPAQGDYRLHAASAIAAPTPDPGEVRGQPVIPAREYLHPRGSRPVAPGPRRPGAFQSTGD